MLFKVDWYVKYLKAAKEKSLLDISDKNLEIYRFTWLRTFHHPIIVRIEKQKDKISVFFKVLDGDSRREPDKFVTDKKNSIGEKDWCKFTNLLNEADYWQMQPKDKSGRDGAFWILEGVKENHYHTVERWQPKEGKYREAALFMLKLSGFDLVTNKDDLY